MVYFFTINLMNTFKQKAAAFLEDLVTFAKIVTPLALMLTFGIVSHTRAEEYHFNPKLGGRHITLPLDPKLDLDKLSKAVACAETSCGKDGTAVHRNNLHGIMCWPNGVRTPCYFKNPAASHAAFKRIWAKSYGRFPDKALATKWTGNDHPDDWLRTVTLVYNAN